MTVSKNSLAHSRNTPAKELSRDTRWIVFTSPLRFPKVTGVVPLPKDIAAICTKHPTEWPVSNPKERILRGFKSFLSAPPPSDRNEQHPIITALRPDLSSDKKANPVHNDAASKSSDSNDGDSAGAGSSMSIQRGCASVLQTIMNNIATHVYDDEDPHDEDTRIALGSCSQHFLTYAETLLKYFEH